MTQKLVSGTPITYEDFRIAVIKPRRTQKAQRQEIESSIKALTAQNDFFSLDIIRKAATALTDDTGAGRNLYFLLWKVITAKPGDILCLRVE
jgi:hypothetical protein